MTDTVDTPDLSQKLAFGALWMISARLLFRCIGLISTVLLARLLLPSDFGVVALAMMIVGMLQTLSEFGFDMALIQNQKATRAHYDTVWTLSLFRGLVSAGLMFAAAEPLAAFFDEPRLAAVMHVLALAPILLQAANPATADFRKYFDFRREFYYLILPKFLSFGVTASCAFVWRNYWALVAGILTYHLLKLIASYLLNSFKPRLCLSAWREVMNFSKWLLVSTIMTVARKRMSALVVARLAGSHMLGVFSVAYEVSNLATSELVAPIKRALYPGYARISGDGARLRSSFINAFGVICLISIPLVTGIALTSTQIVQVMLGENWLETIPFIEVLALAGMLATCRGHARPVYLAINRPSIGAYLSLAEVVLLGASIVVLYRALGVIGVAWAAVIVELFMLICDVVLLRWLIGLRLAEWLREVWRPVSASMAMAAVVTALQDALPAPRNTLDHAGVLLASALVGSAVYGIALLALWLASARTRDCAERNVGRFLRQRLKRRVRQPETDPAAGQPWS